MAFHKNSRTLWRGSIKAQRLYICFFFSLGDNGKIRIMYQLSSLKVLVRIVTNMLCLWYQSCYTVVLLSTIEMRKYESFVSSSS
ncbi:hypothetical protein VNO80_03071 [Phaseolus coccineus]|uniref:Uncharacterized protein n=1 Tax=Phaseolus coccineus TaxID=3886 RepID=A0AAN9RNB3_PHACN